MTVSLRRATAADVDFVTALVVHEDVMPFLAAVRPSGAAEVAALVERSDRDPDAFGLLVIEVDGERAGVVEHELVNRRSAIAEIRGLALHPRFRGRGVALEAARILQRHLLVERGVHRLQLEVYGFNERAIRHFERAGFVREGVRRKAYRRRGTWVDGILFGLVREDLERADTTS
jgi:RimJ/RimL family protein N-acetyltransferase